MSDYARYVVPCKDCADRRVTSDYNCHSDCERFLEYKSACEAKKAKIYAEKNAERKLNEAEFKRHSRSKSMKYYWSRIGKGRFG